MHFWLSLVTIDIHAYIFYLQSVLFARCFEVSFGPARLVVICPHPHPLARSGAVVGHQLCIKVTVSKRGPRGGEWRRRAAPASASAVASATAESRQPRALGRVAAGGDGAGAGG